MDITGLPSELINVIAFSGSLSALDVTRLKQSCTTLYRALSGTFADDMHPRLALEAGGDASWDITRALCGADALARGASGSPCRADWMAAIRVLLARADVVLHARWTDALACAAFAGDPELVAILLADDRIDPTANGSSAVRGAAKAGNVEVLAMLLADGRLDPDNTEDDAPALTIACLFCSNLEVIYMLLADDRVNPERNDNSAIRAAAEKGRTDVVRLLLADARVDPSDEGNEAIGMACMRGFATTVDALLADPRVDPFDGTFALQMAARSGHADVVRQLIADPRFAAIGDAQLEEVCSLTTLAGHHDIARDILRAAGTARSLTPADRPGPGL
ncbi:uncharacterized protein AMSG_07494 [Thecamonas trahens ATCC 50062]|uniref:Uncharacterized protein n=1 Tax=Thecamonas trahens ATCC 50062 TaxID=461836 RepID=A0A0L0DGZ9_THETB|nr:hypothetical protein AMSG_07494 [Thecamonas trahens ATCC 50062]KNC51587.1 hypothetical protein AMSG_07494 [Thecamonas trahens ATCC 50062]|eukprot:XP_013755986.1 hypothetical protein AMSG_07494 [Thecamonas trahens ATCC 50062]